MLVQLQENLQIKLFLHEGLLWYIFRIASVEEIFSKLLSKIHAFFIFIDVKFIIVNEMKPIDSCDQIYMILLSRFESYRGECADLDWNLFNNCQVCLNKSMFYNFALSSCSQGGIVPIDIEWWVLAVLWYMYALSLYSWHVCPCSSHKKVSFFLFPICVNVLHQRVLHLFLTILWLRSRCCKIGENLKNTYSVSHTTEWYAKYAFVYL